MSAPADHPRLVEKAEIWKYFAYVAENKGKPTHITKPVCKRCFKSVMTKRANTSVSLCSVTVCQCETTHTLPAGSEEAERSCTHKRAAPLSLVDILLLSDASETSSSRANGMPSVINAEGNFKLSRQIRLCPLSYCESHFIV